MPVHGFRYGWAKGLLVFGVSFAQGELPLPAMGTLLAVDRLHHVYVWSEVERALYKLWAPRYDSITRIGGAPGEEGFLGITAIAPVGNQQLYVLDAAGQRIVLLGTNLQPLQQLTYAQLPREIAEGYPHLLTVGQAGELYLLLRETQEIVKIDAFGRVLLRFGGKVYGEGRMVGVASLYAENGRIYLVDTVLRRAAEYDAWGNFISALPFPSGMQRAWVSAQGSFFWRGKEGTWERAGASNTSASLTLPASPEQVWIQGNRLYWMAGRRLGWLPLP